ncbi:ABC transporter ATP-binding protein [Clostridium frigidicarnis]|uniref:ATP-binding cassette, subfamily B n=1 Tax=Clostridium frigidicarnis TaxID=84698 RepID=A0A1I0YMC5_9CLOT|nr:ABC transporter ATP-binding protein [Clostridium frigidicarnis]SFB14555.1 ATP-binding cassette, subfamily B [Clostridium frigidicarnis]
MNKIFKYVCRYKALVLIPTVFMLANIILDMINPLLIKDLVDKVIIGKDFSLLLTISISLLVITLSRAIMGYFKEYLFDVMGTKVNRDLKLDLFNHIQSLNFKYFDNMNTGELMSRIGEDVDNIWRTLSFGLRLFIENAIYFVFASIALFYLNWKLALACISIMIPIAFIAMKLEKLEVETYDKISDQNAELNTTAQENIAGVRLVKAFSREKHEILKFLDMNKHNYNLNMNQSKILSKYFPPIEFLTNISIVIMIALGGYLVIKGEITIGVLVAFNGYIWNVIWPVRMLGWLTNLLAQNKASYKKIMKILNTKPEIVSDKNCLCDHSIQGKISFNNVSFQYNDTLILKNITLDIPSGSTIALMGTTGSGKSSLVNLIGRYYDVCSGEILVDDINIKNFDISSLRKSISIVPQDTFLFSDSILENIRFGKKNASLEEIETACNLSCVLDFINDLPDKFQTIVGERGLGLSGGQKQRLSIARALVGNSPILILDDSTSALDMETEFQLLKNLNNHKKHCTTFIIAHRISAVKNADLIVFMDNGEIIEKGTHTELLSLKGKYYEIYCEQFKDFESLTDNDSNEKEVI